MNKDASYILGLIPPDDGLYAYACCDAHKKQPSLIEQELAAKKHRWREMRELQVKGWRAIMQEVTEFEEDLLAVLKLPSIEEVRRFVATGQGQQGGQFTLSTAQIRQIERRADQFCEDLVGKQKESKAFDIDFPTIIAYILQAFTVGLAYARKLLIQNLPEAFDPSIITNIMPDPESRYLIGMIETLRGRTWERVTVEQMGKVKTILREMAREGEWPIKVGRALHKEFGEGQAWYWNRLARSEATLANNAAYNAMSDANGALYDRWSAAPTACPICAAFNGETWRRGEGPEPVGDTHPHCLCIRVPLYNTERTNPRWTRGTPYGPGNGYTREEIQTLRERVRNG